MATLCHMIFLLLLMLANVNGTPATESFTDVVSLSGQEVGPSSKGPKGGTKLEEVATYAELKHDQSRPLPDSFTVCSSIMTASYWSYYTLTFFNILDNHGNQALAPFLSSAHGSVESYLGIGLSKRNSPLQHGKSPLVFPNQWISSCLAINSTSQLILWVVDGVLALTMSTADVPNLTMIPKNLTGKILLGAKSYGGNWDVTRNKVTNLNIFSSQLSVTRMKSMTRSRLCHEEGDHLAWRDMEWVLHGEAQLETFEKEEVCERAPWANLFHTPFVDMEACMHHCENLGTRAPSVATSEDWNRLKKFMKEKVFDKGLDSLPIWLPIQDRDREGEWRDFYTGCKTNHNHQHHHLLCREIDTELHPTMDWGKT